MQGVECPGAGLHLTSAVRPCIRTRVPNLTVYVPRDLADELREHDINVSRVCQAALRRKIRLAQRGSRVNIGAAQCDDSTGRPITDPAPVAS